MDNYNLIFIAFIAAAVVLALWWAFNTVRRIEAQRDFCAIPLNSIAKLWRRAKYIPEDAKERESLYLYRDFLRKFDESECRYPIMVKNGKVRSMTRKEYDYMCGQKNIPSVSLLITAVSILLAVVTIVVNLLVTKTLWLGIGLACIMPIVQIALAVFINRFKQEKNIYRDGIFAILRENSVAFLSVTKPFIVVDAYPDKFGKDTQPLYATIGELTEEQITETRNYIIRQKQAETEVVTRNVNNQAEIEQLSKPRPQKPDASTSTSADNAAVQTSANDPTVPAAGSAPSGTPAPETLSAVDQENLLSNLIDDALAAEVNRAIKRAEQAQQTPEEIEDLAPLPTTTADTSPVVEEPVADVVAPAEDDFSLDAIGQALDAEIAKRSKKK